MRIPMGARVTWYDDDGNKIKGKITDRGMREREEGLYEPILTAKSEWGMEVKLPESAFDLLPLKMWRVHASWQMYGSYEIEAETKEEALELAEDDGRGLPDNGTYVDASFEIDHDCDIEEVQ